MKSVCKRWCLFLLLILIAFELAACTDEVNDGTDSMTQSGTSEESAEEKNDAEKEIITPETPQELPSLYLSIAADNIQHKEWTRGVTVSLQGAGNEFDFVKERARVRGRGNSSWGAMGEKRPFRIRFESPRSMFGTDYIAADWVLLANSIDYSFMRTVGAFGLGARLDRFDFDPIYSQFLHIYLDGDYRGVYQLTDNVQRIPGRVEVDFHSDPALSEYFIEWCRHGRGPDDIALYADELPFLVHYPDSNDITSEHLAYLTNFINEVGQAIRGGDFDEVSALIDIPTFVDFYLVNEFTKNADVFFSSVFFTVRLEENNRHKIYAGPLWDFDQSSGGTFDSFYPDYSPQGPWAATENEWFRRLMRILEFRDMVSERWFEIRDAEVAETLAEIRYLTTVYRDDFERDFERWPDKLGQYLWRTPPAMQAIDTYEGQVDYLLDWYEQRIMWLDEFLS